MKKNLSALLIFFFVVGDLCILNLAIFISYKTLDISLSELEWSNIIYLFIFSGLAWFFLLLITNPYNVSSATQLKVIGRSHFSFLFIHLLVVISLVLFFDRVYQPIQILLLYVYFLLVVFLWRMMFFYLIKIIIQQPLNSVNIVIVGQPYQAYEIRKNFRFHPEYGYRFLEFFDVTNNENLILGDVERFSLENQVNEIYCCWPDTSNEGLKKLIDFGLDHFIKIKVVTDNSTLFQKGIQLAKYGQIPIINMAAIPLDNVGNQIAKRIFDIVFTAFIAITVLSWLIPLIAILIKLDSKGPVFYKQIRAGKSNEPFVCLKFRTMVVNNGAFVQAKQDDPRITRIGRILRKTSLDEFPQFINVLIGDMSIVGPRPHPIKLNDDFASKVRKLMSRHYVKPGITGLAQCMGYRGETKNVLEMKHRIALDRFYVENWTLLFDFRIILQTALSLVKGSDKAY